MNNIITIRPYKFHESWVFDDFSVGLEREALVSGVPEVLEGLCMLKGIPLEEAYKGFNLMFSAQFIPGYQLKAVRFQGQKDNVGISLSNGEIIHLGNWYKVVEPEMMAGMEGWLCPALFKYFDEAPEQLYIKV